MRQSAVPARAAASRDGVHNLSRSAHDLRSHLHYPGRSRHRRRRRDSRRRHTRHCIRGIRVTLAVVDGLNGAQLLACHARVEPEVDAVLAHAVVLEASDLSLYHRAHLLLTVVRDGGGEVESE